MSGCLQPLENNSFRACRFRLTCRYHREYTAFRYEERLPETSPLRTVRVRLDPARSSREALPVLQVADLEEEARDGGSMNIQLFSAAGRREHARQSAASPLLSKVNSIDSGGRA